MGNSIFVKVALFVFLMVFSSCKGVKYKNYSRGRDYDKQLYNEKEKLQKYRKMDELIVKWVNAYIDGDYIGLTNYATELSNIANKEKKSIKLNLEKYLFEQDDKEKSYVLISLVMAGFTNDCSFLEILEKYLKFHDKIYVSNALLGIARLNMCNYSIASIWGLLDNEIDETVILNGFQVVLNHNYVSFYNLENIIDKFIKHRNPLIQNQVIRVIAKYKLAKYINILLNDFLYSPLIYIRTNTAIALTRINDKSIVKSLIDKINEPSFIGKKEAVYVLENLTGQKFGLDSQAWLFWYFENYTSTK